MRGSFKQRRFVNDGDGVCAASSAVKQPTDCRPAVCPSPVFYSRLTGHCPSYPADSRASTELDVCGPDRRRRMIYQSLLAGQRPSGFLAGHSIKASVLFPRPPICIVRRSVGVRYYDWRCDETWNWLLATEMTTE